MAAIATAQSEPIHAKSPSTGIKQDREHDMGVVWKTYRIGPDEGAWEPASYNFRTEDGQEYGRWRRVLRRHPHGLTVISRYKAPPGKAWKIIGKASELGEEVYIMEGAYYDPRATFSLAQAHSCSMHPAHATAVSPASLPSTFIVAAANPTRSCR
jgi:hypothetical protein